VSIAFRSTLRGAHRGSFLGIAPTRTTVTVALLDLVRIADDRILEQWGGPDFLDLLHQ
jgi:predicted ester cyclase